MKYYISDLHLFHYRILEKFNRPFSSVEEMHEVIINNWKNKVRCNLSKSFLVTARMNIFKIMISCYQYFASRQVV